MVRRKKGRIEVLPKSPRHFSADFEYEVIETLVEAQRMPDAYAILEGDYGGQTYVTVPARLVQCDERVLRQLLEDIDDLVWQDPRGQQLSYQKQKLGDHFGGGMGGAEATADVWIHERVLELGIGDNIHKVISGEKPRLDLPEAMVNRIKQERSDRIRRIMESAKNLHGN